MIPAFTGEFGLRVRYHVPTVHALLGKSPQAVQIEHGMEALYPRATEHIIVASPKDQDRHGPAVKVGAAEERFVPQPFVTQGVTARVCIAPRGRGYGAGKNWHHWHLLADLPGVFALGTKASSQSVECPAAWDFNRRELDATIEAINACQLVVASDSGIAHLAMLCGKPLLLLSHHGKVAPGPVIDSRGKQAHAEYWPIRMDKYYISANWKNAPIHQCPTAWDEPASVHDMIKDILG